jgi:hypothetical protein
MTCRDGQHLLQQHLDGDAAPEALERHLGDCPECAASAALVRRYLRGLALLTPAAPPPGLAERVAGRLLREAKARRRGRWQRLAAPGGLAAAAALVLGVGLWAWWPVQGTPVVRVQDEPRTLTPDGPPPAPLRDSMAKASGAFSNLTNRAASDTADSTASLWSLVPKSPLEAQSDAPAPALKPLQEASDGVSTGLAPVTNSARRAVGLFLRDLPVGRSSPDKKPS